MQGLLMMQLPDAHSNWRDRRAVESHLQVRPRECQHCLYCCSCTDATCLGPPAPAA